MDKMVNDIFVKLSKKQTREAQFGNQDLRRSLNDMIIITTQWQKEVKKRLKEAIADGLPEDVIEHLEDQVESGKEMSEGPQQFRHTLVKHGWI